MLVHSLLLSIALRCCCSAHGDPGPTLILLNSTFRPNRTEVVLTAGSAFDLSCQGNRTVRWSSTAFRLMSQNGQHNPIEIRKSESRHTGTYRCSYTNESLGHLHSWIHLYVKDPLHPLSVFVTPRRLPQIKEGEDFLFQCLLTDPSVKNLTFESEASKGHRARGLPPGMSVTIDPRTGVLIPNLQMSFSGRYACSGWKDGTQLKSTAINLIVVRRLRHPPSLSVSQDKFIRLQGEPFEVTCLSSNPTHFYNLTWTHPNIKTLNVTTSRLYSNNRLYLNRTLTVPVVSLNHSGTYTCTAVNEAGVATGTTQLTVLDAPYLRISRIFNTSTSGRDLNRSSSANISGNTRVQVHEGQNVMLTFVMEAYPPIRNQSWITPVHISNHHNMVYEESYSANGYRSETTLLLRRVRQEDRGRYSFNFSNAFFSSSENIDLRIYRSPSAAITQRNNTLTCSGSGYPPPTILFNVCPVQDTCANVSTYEVSAAFGEEEVEEEEVRSRQLPQPGDDVIVECVAYNAFGESRDIFKPGSSQNRPVFFSPILICALTAAVVLLLLLLVVFYKWRKKPKYEIRWKIIESTNGNNYTFVDPTQLPYNHKWEFPREKLRLGTKTSDSEQRAIMFTFGF